MRLIDAEEFERRMRGVYEEYMWDVLADMPPADVVERKKGKWIRHSIGHENTPWGFDCSACGKWFVISEDTAERYNFCPNCGAQMEVENEKKESET